MQKSESPPDRSLGPPLPKSLARFKQWLVAHHMTLMTIADTPHSIALGSAVGIFFGFTPLYGLKTLLSIVGALFLRCNKVAAVIAVTLYDVLIFAMPAIYVAEYKLGCWSLARPAGERVRFAELGFHEYLSWQLFSHVVWPTLVGSLYLGLPSAAIAYFIMRMLVSRSRLPQAQG